MERIYQGMAEEDPIPRPKAPQLKHTIQSGSFTKVYNPDLKMFVYPHIAGKEEVLIPGYYTQFSAYDKDHYLLPSEKVQYP